MRDRAERTGRNGRSAAVSMTSSQTTGDSAAAGTEAVKLLLQRICEDSDVKKITYWALKNKVKASQPSILTDMSSTLSQSEITVERGECGKLSAF